MSVRTPEEAERLLCPLARTFQSGPTHPHCRGPVCALWRWQKLSADLLKPHITARMADQGGKDHKAAVEWVMDNREALGIPLKPTHGFCGMGGRP